MTTTKISQAALAKQLKLSRQRVNQLVKAGMPLIDIDSARAWIRARNEEIGKGTLQPINLNDGRLQKILLECQKIQQAIVLNDIALAKERGELISRKQAKEDGEQAGALIMGLLSSFTNRMPAQLAGREEAKVRSIMQGEVDELLRALHWNLGDKSDRRFPKLRAAAY
jgi:hypothetical protein